jgi:uncharacterized protein with PQ loop repeat
MENLNNINYDYFGWLAMIITCASFLPNNQKQIRILNSFACVIWILYALLINNQPMFAVNLIVLLIHFFWFFNNKKYKIK